ncbi:glucosaminidase domain-containing protein [Bacillus cereus]|uniref:Cell wall-associated glycosyl hydrolase n=1 Tax=Bacillus cereus TaxID=1396 RepID=A0A164QD28_BACCE|nr:glucosaminidase domain-containing protein [Bacillus cereus]KZD71141.1 Cell wall-associated glycosyl hydrolase [Bacillus cereus]
MNPYNGNNLNYQNNGVNVIKRTSTKSNKPTGQNPKEKRSDGKKVKKLAKTASMCVIIASACAIATAKYHPMDQAKAYVTENAPEAQKTVKDIPVVGGALVKGIEKVVDIDQKKIPSTSHTTKAIEGAVPLLKDTPQEKQEVKKEEKKEEVKEEKKEEKKEELPTSLKKEDIPKIEGATGGLQMKAHPNIEPREKGTQVMSVSDIMNNPSTEPKDALEEYTPDSSIQKTDRISAETIDKFLATNEGSELKGYGKLIRKAALDKGIEPGFLTAIIFHETAEGTSNVLKTYNNAGGIMCMQQTAKGAYDGCKGKNPDRPDTAFMSYNTIEEGLFHVGHVLYVNYLSYDLTTISAIGNQYSPTNAKNQVGNENTSWIPSVTKFMNKMVEIEKETRAQKGQK